MNTIIATAALAISAFGATRLGLFGHNEIHYTDKQPYKEAPQIVPKATTITKKDGLFKTRCSAYPELDVHDNDTLMSLGYCTTVFRDESFRPTKVYFNGELIDFNCRTMANAQ